MAKQFLRREYYIEVVEKKGEGKAYRPWSVDIYWHKPLIGKAKEVKQERIIMDNGDTTDEDPFNFWFTLSEEKAKMSIENCKERAVEKSRLLDEYPETKSYTIEVK